MIRNLLIALIICSPVKVFADDLKTMLEKVQKLAEEENYSKALEELAWAKKDLEKSFNDALSKHLPDTIEGMTGNKVQINSALGITNISRTYTEGKNRAKIEIQGGSGTGGGAMGGLGAFGQMAAMFGQQQGQSSMRIKGRTANLNENKGELVLFLDGGSMINVKKERGDVDLKSIVESLDLDAIEKSIKGR